MTASVTFKTPFPPLGSLSPSTPYYPPSIDIAEPAVREMMDPEHYPKNWIMRHRWTRSQQSRARLYLNTFVWVCHPYESKPELGRIISIESQSYGPGTNPKLYYTIMKQRLDEFNWRWTDTYTGVFDYDEIELVELVSQGLAFLGRYVEDPLLCR